MTATNNGPTSQETVNTVQVVNGNKSSGTNLPNPAKDIRENYLNGNVVEEVNSNKPVSTKQNFSIVPSNSLSTAQTTQESGGVWNYITSTATSAWNSTKNFVSNYIVSPITTAYTATASYISSSLSGSNTTTSQTTSSLTSSQSLTSGTLTKQKTTLSDQKKLEEQQANLQQQQAKVVLENGKPKINVDKNSWEGWALGLFPEDSLKGLAKQEAAAKDLKEGKYGSAFYKSVSATFDSLSGSFQILEGIGSYLGLGEVIKGIRQLSLDTAKSGIKIVMSLAQGDFKGAWDNLNLGGVGNAFVCLFKGDTKGFWDNVNSPGLATALFGGVSNILYGAANFLGLVHIGKGMKQMFYDAPQLLGESAVALFKGDYATASAKLKEAGWTALCGAGNQLLGGIILGVNLLSFGYGGAALNVVGRFTSRIGLGLAERFGVQLTTEFATNLATKVLGRFALSEGTAITANMAEKKLITLTLDKGQQLLVQGIKGVGEKEMIAFLKEIAQKRGYDVLKKAAQGGVKDLEKLAVSLSEEAGQHSLKFLQSFQKARAEEFVSKMLSLTDRGFTQRMWHRVAPTRFAKYIEKTFAKEFGETITREQSLSIATELLTKEGRALLSRLPKMTRYQGSASEEVMVQGITNFLQKEFVDTGLKQFTQGLNRGIRVHLHDMIREIAVESGLIRKATEQEIKRNITDQGIERGLITENWRGKIQYVVGEGQTYKQAVQAYQQFEKKLLENPISKYTWNINKDDIVVRSGETAEAALKRTQIEFQKRYKDLSRETLENSRPTVKTVEETVVPEMRLKAKDLYKREVLEETVRNAVRERLARNSGRRIYDTSLSLDNSEPVKFTPKPINVKPNYEDVNVKYKFRDDAEYWGKVRGKTFEELLKQDQDMRSEIDKSGKGLQRNSLISGVKNEITESVVSKDFKENLQKSMKAEQAKVYDRINAINRTQTSSNASRELTAQSIQASPFFVATNGAVRSVKADNHASTNSKTKILTRSDREIALSNQISSAATKAKKQSS